MRFDSGSDSSITNDTKPILCIEDRDIAKEHFVKQPDKQGLMEGTGYANVTIATETCQIEIFGHSIRVSVRRTGREGPPLLLFNGIGANLELLQPFIEALGDIETVVFDIPGAGASPEPLLPYRLFDMACLANRLMTKLGYEGEFDVFGVSWGGALAQQFAVQYRRRCRRLVLAATSQGMLMFRVASDPC